MKQNEFNFDSIIHMLKNEIKNTRERAHRAWIKHNKYSYTNPKEIDHYKRKLLFDLATIEDIVDDFLCNLLYKYKKIQCRRK